MSDDVRVYFEGLLDSDQEDIDHPVDEHALDPPLIRGDLTHPVEGHEKGDSVHDSEVNHLHPHQIITI